MTRWATLFSVRPMQSAIVLSFLSCLLPLAARANSPNLSSSSSTCIPGVALCVFNQNGTAVGGATGLMMNGTATGSTASTVVQIGSTQGPDIGSLMFTTGALTSGTLGNRTIGNVVTFAPGTLTITTTGWNNFSGTLFSGTFSSITWTLYNHAGGQWDYILSGAVSGSWEGGATVNGVTTQIFFHSPKPWAGGPISLASGTTAFVVPEGGTIGLMGTGLIGMGLLIRRKARHDKRASSTQWNNSVG